MGAVAGVAKALTDVVDELVVGGVRATLDPAELNLPSCWVTVDSITPELLSGDGTVRVRVNLLVPDAAHPDALQLLDELLGDVLTIVDPEDTITPESVGLPNGATVPSYRLNLLRPYTRTETP